MSAESVVFKGQETGAEAPDTKTNDTNANHPEKKEEQNSRPEWLPENFKDVDSFVKSSQDTRAELTRAQQELAKFKKPDSEEGKPDDDGTEKPEGENKEQDAAKKAVEASGLDVAPYQAEFNETGDVSPENRKKIAEGLKAQFGDDAESLVNDFIEGQKMRLTNYRNSVMEPAGGEEGYNEMVEWAASSLKPEEIESFNKAVDTGDINAASLAVQGLKAKYEAANGVAPNLIEGEKSQTGVGFATAYEMQQAMSKKDDQGRTLYKVDPTYRKKVEDRVKISNFK